MRDSLNNTEARTSFDKRFSEHVKVYQVFLKEKGLKRMTPEADIEWRKRLGWPPRPLVESMRDPGRDASCLQCLDMGWVYPKGSSGVEFADPAWGKAVPCQKCSTWEEERRGYAMEQSGIPVTRRESRFESFILPPQRASYRASVDVCFDAAYQLAKGTSSQFMLLIYGKTGCGKTHLAYAAGLVAISRGLRTIFQYTPELFRNLRSAMDKGQNSGNIIDNLINCGFLILDDIAVRNPTEWQAEVIEQIVDSRWANHRPLFATTNREADALGKAVLRRFMDPDTSFMIRNEAPDFKTSGRWGNR